MKRSTTKRKLGDGFVHNQSAELVDEIRKRADAEQSSRNNTNEMGQQSPDTAPPTKAAKRLTPQQLRERPRE